MTDKTKKSYEPSAEEMELAADMDGLTQTITLTLPRYSDVKIGRAGSDVRVDLLMYPDAMLSRTFRYGLKRRYNDNQSSLDKKTWEVKVRDGRTGSDVEHHAFLIETALKLRANTYAGIWAEGGGGGLPLGVKEMRLNVMETFNKKDITLKLKVSDIREISDAEKFARVLVEHISATKKEPIPADQMDETIGSVMNQWRDTVKTELAFKSKRGNVEI